MTSGDDVHVAVIIEGGVATHCFAGDGVRQVERQLVAHLLDEAEWRLHADAFEMVQRCLGAGDHAGAIATFFAPEAQRWDALTLARHVVPYVASPLAALEPA